MKKLISLLLAIAMLVCCIPVSAFAADEAYFVAGTAELCGNAWACNDEANKMTLNADGLYEKVYVSVPAGTHEFKVTDGTWDNSWGKDGSNFKFTLDEVQDVTITFNADTKEIAVLANVTETPAEYYVAGTKALCTEEWNPGYAGNKMSRVAVGVYEKVFYNVPAGSHEFKVTDGSWSNCWGDNGNNFAFTTTESKNVTITFTEETKEIKVTLSDVGLPRYIAGTEALCGVGWNPGYEGNKMVLGADGLYTKTFKCVPAGTHEFKVTDGSWSNCWGDNGNNYVFTTDEAHDVTITFNDDTKEINVILSEASEPDPIVPIDPSDYDITIKVHYYRADGNYDGWEVHMWNGVESLSSTRAFEDDEVTYNGTTYAKTATYYADAADTWVGFIIKKPDWTKDPDGDRHIDVSKVLNGTVHVYAKSGSALEDFDTDISDCTLGAKITAAVWDSLTGVLTVTTSMAIEGDLNGLFTLEGPDGEIEITNVTLKPGTESDYIVEYAEGAISKENKYVVHYNGASCDVTIPNTYSTPEFEAAYTYTRNDLGATWSAEGTLFRVWAPTASEVILTLYDAGIGGNKINTYSMTADANGTWFANVEGNLHGVYYTYSVNIMGEVAEACDPYARATGINGDRAMVINLDSTDPEGWENDTYVTQENYTDAVIWELHVRDFSIDESSGMNYKGKYLAFTEKGTTVPGTDIATGVDYMKELGVNYVHLLPVYDINSVDETVGGYNWGYDPKNYNVPEGSYSTDPYNGEVRVNEFKQMVQALHDAEIGVIMDVVYNHVADAGNFCFNRIVPGYFSRIHDDGSYQSNSGCGNDTATERSMVRKYIVDSVLYWAEEYHIDGFRWDLVGLIDYETINAVMAAVHAVNPEIIFYGEGWEMCSWTTKEGYVNKMTIQPNDDKVNTEAGTFAFFNDTIRNVIHGGVFTATDKGFVSGNMNAGTKQTVIEGYMGNSTWGSNGGSVDTPLQTVNYASCHDNYTLFDNLTIDAMDATGKSASEVKKQAAAMNRLAAAYYITAQGVPFIHAGEEMLRSKPDAQQENGFNHNSYASGDEINSIKWATLEDELVSDTVDYYAGLIAFREAHPAMRMTTEAEIQAAMTVLETNNNNVVALLNEGGNGEDTKIITIINADAKNQSVELPDGYWDVYVNAVEAGTEVLSTEYDDVWVGDTSVKILVEHEHRYKDGWCTGCGEEQPGSVPAPEGLSAGPTNPNGTLVIEWDEVDGAAAYELTVYDEDMEFIRTVTTKKTSVKHTSAVPYKTYYYTVASIDEYGYCSEPSEAVYGYAKVAAPKVTVSHTPAGKIQLTWTAVEGADMYDVVVYDTSKTSWLFPDGEIVNIAHLTGTSVKHTSAEPGKTYRYMVLALFGSYETGFYTSASIEVTAECTAAAPTVTASNVAKTGKVKLTWTAVEGAAQYKVYRSTEKDGKYSLMYTTAGTSYTNTKAEAGMVYFYKVVAVDAEGNAVSAMSAAKQRTCDLPQTKLSGSVNKSGNPALTWEKVEDAVAYKVYRADASGTYKLMKTTTGTSYTNTNNKAGTTYTYYVVAVAENTAANSAASNIVKLTAK